MGRASAAGADSFRALAVYASAYLGLSWKWLAHARTASGVGFNRADELLVVWILGWGRKALETWPTRLFDAPINFPAPLQLAGSEHLLSFQLLFAPLYAIFGDNFLSANLTVFLTYPLTALAMQQLLLALGCSTATSLVVGLAFPLGPMQVPASPHVLQYLNLFLPLVALCLLRLRESPGPIPATALFVVTRHRTLG